MILGYSTLIHTCNYKQLNYKKYASNNTTAVHVLRHRGKNSLFSQNDKKKTEKGQKCTNTYQNKEFFYNFEKHTLIHLKTACMKGLKKRSALFKMHQIHINDAIFLFFLSMIFSDCFQSFFLSVSFLTCFFFYFLNAKTIFLQVK